MSDCTGIKRGTSISEVTAAGAASISASSNVQFIPENWNWIIRLSWDFKGGIRENGKLWRLPTDRETTV